ncbi:MAG TPA: ATP-binding cassette domain-containing protein [Actinobacteria bacterium]|jgi:ABC-2 type transport system ATP-binding protein|nr:ATP-binding cassette domain-containing protein [Actinomycetota bacterium]
MESIFKVRNLTKKYGNLTAVDSIEFSINKGEIFGFLGPNAAGKTTTINMLIGMAKVTSGRIFYRDNDTTDKIKKFQALIGVVPDESNLYEELTGFENLCFCASLYGINRVHREVKARQLLEIFKLSDAAHKRFKAYSKGMKRKLTIAASLVHEPEILFLDEPTTGIDVASSRQIRSLIKKLNDDGMTVFLTTHYIEEAERLCDRIAFINKGKIIKMDTVKKFIDDISQSNIIEVLFEPNPIDKNVLLEKINLNFPELECSFKDENTIKIISQIKINVSSIVSFLSSNGIYILEAKLLRPTLEDAFVKLTGIEIDTMKKEKEKK